jgi:hypothetical protein
MIRDESSFATADARYGELLRLQFLLDNPDFNIDSLRQYVAERMEAVYPPEYHLYRRRWDQLAAGTTPGEANWPRLSYLEWRQAVDTLVEELRLADMLGEEESERAKEWRAALMIGPEWEQGGTRG